MFDYRHTMNNLACAEIKVSQTNNNNDNNISQLGSRLDFICFLFMYVYTFFIYTYIFFFGMSESFLSLCMCMSELLFSTQFFQFSFTIPSLLLFRASE